MIYVSAAEKEETMLDLEANMIYHSHHGQKGQLRRVEKGSVWGAAWLREGRGCWAVVGGQTELTENDGREN